MRVAAVPWLDVCLSGADRLEALLFPAIEQALASLDEKQAGSMRMAISVGLPSARRGLAADCSAAVVRSLRERFGNVLTAVASFPIDHPSGLWALEAAAKKLAQGSLDACVVAGVDSYIEPDTLEWLEEVDQLHGAGPLNNAWGFIPGEGAGAILLVRDEVVRRLRLKSLARMLGIGLAVEPKRPQSGAVCIGEGLTSAFRGALAALPDGVKVSDVYCDMNGEPYRADEFGFAALRTSEYFQSASDFVAPADCWGDVAAAGVPLHLMLASIAGAKGYARGRLALVWSSGASGERSAALLAVGAE